MKKLEWLKASSSANQQDTTWLLQKKQFQNVGLQVMKTDSPKEKHRKIGRVGKDK